MVLGRQVVADLENISEIIQVVIKPRIMMRCRVFMLSECTWRLSPSCGQVVVPDGLLVWATVGRNNATIADGVSSHSTGATAGASTS